MGGRWGSGRGQEVRRAVWQNGGCVKGWGSERGMGVVRGAGVVGKVEFVGGGRGEWKSKAG